MTRDRRVHQSGNAILEAGLVFLPFVALFLAIIDYSLVIFKRNSFENAVREGTRYAITGQHSGAPAACTQDSDIKAIVQLYSMGFVSDPTMIHIDYFDPVTQAPTLSNAAGNLVTVSIQGYTHDWIAAVWRSGTPLPVGASSSDLVEPSPVGGAPCR